MATSTDWQSGKSLSECLGHVLKENISTDVTFLLGEEKVPVHAHKLILISRSPVFQAMLDGPMAETGDIEIPDITKETFSLLLQYMYTDKLTLHVKTVISVMAAARKYCFDRLIGKCRNFVNKSVNIQNVGMLFKDAHTYMEEDVMEKCLGLIKVNAVDFLQSENLNSLCQECVYRITKADELCVTDEHDVFEAAVRWSVLECERQGLEDTDINRRKVLGNILFEIRFPLMSDSFLGSEICGGDLLTAEEIKTAFQIKHKKGTSELFKAKARKARKLLNFPRFSNHEGKFGPIKDATTISVSRRGYLSGVLFYKHQCKDIAVSEIKVLDDQGNCLARRKDISVGKALFSNLFELPFHEKILLQKEKKYSIHVTMNNGIIAFGNNGKTIVETESTKVQFYHHPDSAYSTINQSIISGIIFG